MGYFADRNVVRNKSREGRFEKKADMKTETKKIQDKRKKEVETVS